MEMGLWPCTESERPLGETSRYDTRLLILDRLARCAEMCAEYADAVAGVTGRRTGRAAVRPG